MSCERLVDSDSDNDDLLDVLDDRLIWRDKPNVYCEEDEDYEYELEIQVYWASKIDMNATDMPDVINKSLPNFKPGIISEFSPGVHYVDDDFQFMCDDPCFDFDACKCSIAQSCNMYAHENTSPSHLYATYYRIKEPGYKLPEANKVRSADLRNLDAAEIMIKHEFDLVNLLNVTSDQDVLGRLKLNNCTENVLSFPGVLIYFPPGCGQHNLFDQYKYRIVDTDCIFDPNVATIQHMGELRYTVITDMCDMSIPYMPTVMVIPDDDTMALCMRENASFSEDAIEQRIHDIYQFIDALCIMDDDITENKWCVTIIRPKLDDLDYAYLFENLKF